MDDNEARAHSLISEQSDLTVIHWICVRLPLALSPLPDSAARTHAAAAVVVGCWLLRGGFRDGCLASR